MRRVRGRCVRQNLCMAKKDVLIAAPRRLFADDYSSSGQRAWSEGERGTGPAYWKDDYCGQLRFDSLLSPTLVIPDSHVFDGPYFLETGPAWLESALGRSGLGEQALPALEIRGREETLSGSLASLLRRPGHTTLNAFVFKSIDPSVRHLLAAELKQTAETELDEALARASDVPAGVAGVLETCLNRIDSAINAKVLVGPLEESWRRWLHEASHLVVESWPTCSTFDLNAQIGREVSIDGNLTTDTGRDALADVRAVIALGSGHRSDISELLAGFRSDTTEDGALTDLELVDLWYSRLRYRALAARHGCGCALADRPWLPAVGPGQALVREALQLDQPCQVPLPDDVLTALGDLQPADFSEFVRRHRRTIVRLWAQHRLDDLHAVADALAGFVRERQRPGLGIAQTLPAAGGAAGTLAGGLGGPIGGVIGTVGKVILDRRKTDTERVRIRVQEAMMDRLSEHS
jgi:hypothetical protein